MFELKVDEDILLKEISVENSGTIYNAIDSCRKYLGEWLEWVENTKAVEDTIDYIQSVINHDMFSGRFVMEIWYKNEFAGLIDFHNGSKVCKKAEIGYWLVEKFQGKGIMTKACKASIDYGFNSIGLNRIVIRCALDNYKSQAIPKRLKFVQEGIEREGEFLHGKYIDLYTYSMLSREWLNN